MPVKQTIDLGSTALAETQDRIEWQTQWGIFLADPGILESTQREELKAYLEKLLAGIHQRHTTSDSQPFPTTAELTRLTEVVNVLANVLGKRRREYGELFSAMKRIENRFSNLPLILFADNLLKKLCKVPASPRTIVNQAMEKYGEADTGRRKLLEEIDQFLDCKNGPVDFSAPWEKWRESVKGLVFPDSFLSCPRNAEALQKNFLAVVGDHGRLLAFLYFMDLRRLQSEWMIRYAEQTQASLAWIHLLQRPSDFDRLKQVYFGSTLPPQEMRDGLDTLANRERRIRSYRKKVIGMKQEPGSGSNPANK